MVYAKLLLPQQQVCLLTLAECQDPTAKMLWYVALFLQSAILTFQGAKVADVEKTLSELNRLAVGAITQIQQAHKQSEVVPPRQIKEACDQVLGNPNLELSLDLTAQLEYLVKYGTIPEAGTTAEFLWERSKIAIEEIESIEAASGLTQLQASISKAMGAMAAFLTAFEVYAKKHQPIPQSTVSITLQGFSSLVVKNPLYFVLNASHLLDAQKVVLQERLNMQSLLVTKYGGPHSLLEMCQAIRAEAEDNIKAAKKAISAAQYQTTGSLEACKIIMRKWGGVTVAKFEDSTQEFYTYAFGLVGRVAENEEDIGFCTEFMNLMVEISIDNDEIKPKTKTRHLHKRYKELCARAFKTELILEGEHQAHHDFSTLFSRLVGFMTEFEAQEAFGELLKRVMEMSGSLTAQIDQEADLSNLKAEDAAERVYLSWLRSLESHKESLQRAAEILKFAFELVMRDYKSALLKFKEIMEERQYVNILNKFLERAEQTAD